MVKTGSALGVVNAKRSSKACEWRIGVKEKGEIRGCEKDRIISGGACVSPGRGTYR